MKKKNRNRFYKLIRNMVDPLFSKDKNKITLFASTGVVDSNLECVKSYLEYYHKNKEVKVILAKNKYTKTEYINIFYQFFKSYYIIADHALPRFVTNRKRKIFNVWHGIPLKTIRHLDNKRFTSNFLNFESENLNGLVCSSELDKAVMAACFNINSNKCILSGLPRADILSNHSLEWFKDPQETELVSLLDEKKLIAWMPTYRGTWHQKNMIEAFTENDERQLLNLLLKHNAILGVRPHKFSKLQEFPLLKRENRIIDLSVFDMCNTVLKYTTHLITDYSSVWLDYSLISKGISLYLFDSNEYDDARGMIYPLSDVFPGVISREFNELYSDIDSALQSNTEPFNPSRLFFKYTDNNNTRRFVEAMFNNE